MSAHTIKPKDPELSTVHPRVQAPRFSPHFDKCIGALDGTHVRVVVPIIEGAATYRASWVYNSECIGHM